MRSRSSFSSIDDQSPSDLQFMNTSSIHMCYSTTQTTSVVTEESLRAIFSVYGVIQDITVKKYEIDPNHNLQRGYGFVHYAADEEGIQAAIRRAEDLRDRTIDSIHYKCDLSHKLQRQLNEQGRETPFGKAHSSRSSLGNHTGLSSRSNSFGYKRGVRPSPLHHVYSFRSESSIRSGVDEASELVDTSNNVGGGLDLSPLVDTYVTDHSYHSQQYNPAYEQQQNPGWRYPPYVYPSNMMYPGAQNSVGGYPPHRHPHLNLPVYATHSPSISPSYAMLGYPAPPPDGVYIDPYAAAAGYPYYPQPMMVPQFHPIHFPVPVPPVNAVPAGPPQANFGTNPTVITTVPPLNSNSSSHSNSLPSTPTISTPFMQQQDRQSYESMPDRHNPPVQVSQPFSAVQMHQGARPVDTPVSFQYSGTSGGSVGVSSMPGLIWKGTNVMSNINELKDRTRVGNDVLLSNQETVSPATVVQPVTLMRGDYSYSVPTVRSNARNNEDIQRSQPLLSNSGLFRPVSISNANDAQRLSGSTSVSLNDGRPEWTQA